MLQHIDITLLYTTFITIRLHRKYNRGCKSAIRANCSNTNVKNYIYDNYICTNYSFYFSVPTYLCTLSELRSDVYNINWMKVRAEVTVAFSPHLDP